MSRGTASVSVSFSYSYVRRLVWKRSRVRADSRFSCGLMSLMTCVRLAISRTAIILKMSSCFVVSMNWRIDILSLDDVPRLIFFAPIGFLKCMIRLLMQMSRLWCQAIKERVSDLTFYSSTSLAKRGSNESDKLTRIEIVWRSWSFVSMALRVWSSRLGRALPSIV